MKRIKYFGESFFALFSRPLVAMLAALLLFALVAMRDGPLFRVSDYFYYNYLADAFLHGQLNLRLVPPSTVDLVLYHGLDYLYWPPGPAILLMPLVALFGIEVSDVCLCVLLAGLSVGAVALLLKQVDLKGLIPLDASRRGLLIVFLAAGSVLLPLVRGGRVWAVGQLTGFLFVALAYLAAVSLEGWPAFLLTGLALSVAAATRNHLVFTGIWPAYHLLSSHWKAGWKKIAALTSLALLPVMLTVLGLAWYNFVRFGSPTDVGLAYHNMAPFFQADFEKYGAFNLHYLATNIYYQYIYYPFPWTAQSDMGGSLFLLSPILFAVFWGLAQGRPRLSVLALVLSILATSVPILLLMGTGWVQVGPRYTLDFHIPLILLAALGLKRWRVWLVSLLVLAGCVQYFLALHAAQ